MEIVRLNDESLIGRMISHFRSIPLLKSFFFYEIHLSRLYARLLTWSNYRK